ncbi:MAG: hypothetical protein ACKVT2_00045, partial [Saprospiraceae bacterium]
TINEDERADPGNFFGLSQDNKMLEWRQNKAGKTNLVEMFSLSQALQKWMEKQEKDTPYTHLNLPIKERSLNFSGRKGNLRLIVQEMQLEIAGNETRVNYCNGWILLKEKK